MRSDTRRQDRRVEAFVTLVALAAIALIALLVQVDVDHGYAGVNWVAFGLFSVLLFVGETRPSMWMRLGDGGEVTPGWAFAYALVLLGAPAMAVVVMVATNLIVDIQHRKGVLKIVFNSSQIAAALAAGGLVLHGFGLHDGISGSDSVPMSHAIGIVVGAVAIFAVNGVLIVSVIGLHQGDGFVRTLRAWLGLSMTADASLLALAPVFVIVIEYSVVMLPLLAVTSFLVYHSARHAIRSEHEATHDPLTKLLNRRAFDQRLANELDALVTGDSLIAVLVMDLDRFKDINDRLGHQVGDRLLVSFASRLERALPGRASASRLGGDEFGVMIPDVESATQVRALVEELHRDLSRQHDLDGFPLTVGVSIGVAIAPDNGTTGEALVAAADIAMYRAKRYETGVEFGGPRQQADDHGRVGLLHDLAGAITNAEIRAHYQPQIGLVDGSVESVEALMRWTHPTYGPIPPGEFIGVAEQTDLIGPITEAMFRNAMTDLLTLGPAMPNLAVNVAPRSLLDRRFAGRVLGIIDEVGFPAHRLEIEITERAIVTGSERTALTLDQLREAGVSVSIDDFGTGYSSFRILRDVRADRLKVDRQFTSQLVGSRADELIVAKVIELAHGLGLDVVAEGVESQAVWEQLRTMQCDIAQGYAIAPPMPLDELRSWLSTWSARYPAPTNETATFERSRPSPLAAVLPDVGFAAEVARADPAATMATARTATTPR